MCRLFLVSVLASAAVAAEEKPARLVCPAFEVEIDTRLGAWSLVDAKSGVRWPTEGTSKAGNAKGLEGGFDKVTRSARSVQLTTKNGNTVQFAIADDEKSLQISYGGKDIGDIRLLGDCSVLTDRQDAAVIVPCREGLLIPADSGVSFKHVFGTSEYEGCHMNMLGWTKSRSTLVVTWEDASVWPEVRSELTSRKPHRQELSTELVLKQRARSVRLTPLGAGDWNTLAAGYRQIAEQRGLAVTLQQKISRNPHAEHLLGAANVKLWTCLARRMSEDSTRVEQVRVHWTFAEAASIAEHLKRDLKIDRCLFTIGGWTEGGYDCRHPDNLPANVECGGDQALADAIRRIQDLGYVACLHDNYQDMYKDAKSWDPGFIQKRPDGSLAAGGRWLGGRAYLVCAPEQIKLAMRPQNLPAIRARFGPLGYFIDTTYAVGPQECFDAKHPIGRNDDIASKIKLSEAARRMFGIFGSECGREWALPCSDFFEGLVGVAGRDYHNLKSECLGAQVIPFWEMVYHDCQVCYGKYGYDAGRAAKYVAHHLLAARPLNYHSIPDHLYWKARNEGRRPSGDQACYTRADQGWAEGLHPVDAFLKTTHEVLGPLHLTTAGDRLTRFEFLGSDCALRRATYGESQDATVVVVNDGPTEARAQSRLGGSVVLPPWGFVIDGPRFAAFFARHWNGRDYPEGALFTLRPAGDETLIHARRVRVFHGFGDPRIDWRGSTYVARREAVIDIPVASSREAAGAAEPLKVGVFAVDASPPLGSPLAYDPTKGVTHPLSCRGVVLLGDGRPVVLCAVDWIGIGNDGQSEFRQALAAAAGTAPERVVVHTLHQHDAPACDFSTDRLLARHGINRVIFDAGFNRSVIVRAAAAVRVATLQARPVTHLGLGQAEVEKVASNRRILGPDGKVQYVRWTACKEPQVRAMPVGTIDPELKLISFWDGTEPVAALTYYATHPQSYYRTGLANPDFPGMARDQRQKATNVAHIHFNGAGGNIGAGKWNDGAPENRQVLADRVAMGMARAWADTKKGPILAADLSWESLPVALPPAPHLEAKALEAILNDASKPVRARAQAAHELIWLQRCHAGKTIDVSCLHLGKARVLHLPGELFVEYQLAAQRLRPDLFVAMAAYGDYAPGYIGTEVAYSQGGYETGQHASLVAPNVERTLMDTIKRLLAK